MANKVVYNNTSYDIVDAITISGRNYLVLVDPVNLNNISYLENAVVNGENKYLLPPKTFDVSNNPNCDLKRLQINFVMTTLVNMLKVDGTIRTEQDLKTKIGHMKQFVMTDVKLSKILDENMALDLELFVKINDYLEKYLNEELLSNEQKEYDYLNRNIYTKDGLDYEWLYDLDLQQLKELASQKDRTSGELIYILDALNKRENTDKSLEQYNEMGRTSYEEPHTNKAAFIDIVLLSLITASFSLLLLLGLF